MLSRWLPGLLWLENYNQSLFTRDLSSGIVIAFMLIPQGMGYAMVAGLPPETGLYACIIPPVIYALLGTSNKISTGPVALDSILIITGLSVLAEPGSPRYLELAVALTILVGLIQALLGMLKFGFISNFLSYPVIVGYTSAAALIIMGSQLESLLGVEVEGGNVFMLLYQLLAQMSQWHGVTVLLGVAAFVFMLLPKRWFPKVPYALLLLVAGMLCAGTTGLVGTGIDVVSSVPTGLPVMSLPTLSLSDYYDLLPVALTVALMGYVGTMSICKSLESPTDPIATRPNQELLAIGAANLIGGLFRAFPVSASFSRSAAFRQSGAATQISALFSSLCILLLVLFFTPLFAHYPLPKVFLSVIIIVSVLGLFKYREMLQLLRENRRDFIILLVTFTMTLLLGVQEGLFLGVFLSIAMVIYNTANPHMTELGAIEDGDLFRNVNRFSNAVVREDVLIFRFDAPLYFANKDYFVEQLYRWVKQRNGQNLRYIIFDAEAVNSVDSTALLMLSQVIEGLKRLGIELYISNAIGPVRDELNVSSLKHFVCEGSMFSTINDALNFIDNGVNVHANEAIQTNA
ncbi:MAG: sodium-independent anion transporter [Cellvibrionaceae bacterium]|nr:sodium-independent anion transporter [Cellvibrionaceae bacterium]|tara:strand:- start:2570 stop:4288 length:1719 start_codon:yes stop_codon:yes gene_type:complete